MQGHFTNLPILCPHVSASSNNGLSDMCITIIDSVTEIKDFEISFLLENWKGSSLPSRSGIASPTHSCICAGAREECTEEPDWDHEKGISKCQSPLRTQAHRDEGHPGNGEVNMYCEKNNQKDPDML